MDTGYNSSIRHETRKYKKQVLQIKISVESYVVIYCSEYESGIRNLYCQGDSLF